eukprot:403374504
MTTCSLYQYSISRIFTFWLIIAFNFLCINGEGTFSTMIITDPRACKLTCLDQSRKFCSATNYLTGFCCEMGKNCSQGAECSDQLPPITANSNLKYFTCPHSDKCGSPKILKATNTSQKVAYNKNLGYMTAGEMCGFKLLAQIRSPLNTLNFQFKTISGGVAYIYSGGTTFKTSTTESKIVDTKINDGKFSFSGEQALFIVFVSSSGTVMNFEFSYALNITTFYEPVIEDPTEQIGDGTNGTINQNSTSGTKVDIFISANKDSGILPLPILIGIGAGGALLFISVGITIYCVLKKRKNQQKVAKISNESNISIKQKVFCLCKCCNKKIKIEGNDRKVLDELEIKEQDSSRDLFRQPNKKQIIEDLIRCSIGSINGRSPQDGDPQSSSKFISPEQIRGMNNCSKLSLNNIDTYVPLERPNSPFYHQFLSYQNPSQNQMMNSDSKIFDNKINSQRMTHRIAPIQEEDDYEDFTPDKDQQNQYYEDKKRKCQQVFDINDKNYDPAFRGQGKNGWGQLSIEEQSTMLRLQNSMNQSNNSDFRNFGRIVPIDANGNILANNINETSENSSSFRDDPIEEYELRRKNIKLIKKRVDTDIFGVLNNSINNGSNLGQSMDMTQQSQNRYNFNQSTNYDQEESKNYNLNDTEDAMDKTMDDQRKINRHNFGEKYSKSISKVKNIKHNQEDLIGYHGQSARNFEFQKYLNDDDDIHWKHKTPQKVQSIVISDVESDNNDLQKPKTLLYDELDELDYESVKRRREKELELRLQELDNIIQTIDRQ